jgi:hypothetical protein
MALTYSLTVFFLPLSDIYGTMHYQQIFEISNGIKITINTNLTGITGFFPLWTDVFRVQRAPGLLFVNHN